MWNLTDGDFDNYADGLSTEEKAFQIVERQDKMTAMLTESAVIVGTGAFWAWLSGYREGGLPEVIAGSGLTLDAVVGVGLTIVNMLGYGGAYESWLQGAANGSLTHFAIVWAAKKGAEMRTAAGYQYEEPRAMSAGMGAGTPAYYGGTYADAYAR